MTSLTHRNRQKPTKEIKTFSSKELDKVIDQKDILAEQTFEQMMKKTVLSSNNDNPQNE